MSFKPEFDNEVYELGLSNQPIQLNPNNYATPLSAMQLADELAALKPTVVMDWPFVMAPGPSPFSLHKKVPYLLFPSGYRELAGALQMWWIRCPEPEGLALRYCKAQIASDEADYLQTQKDIAEGK